jgi:hypothetical protein
MVVQNHSQSIHLRSTGDLNIALACAAVAVLDDIGRCLVNRQLNGVNLAFIQSGFLGVDGHEITNFFKVAQVAAKRLGWHH